MTVLKSPADEPGFLLCVGPHARAVMNVLIIHKEKAPV